MKILLTGGSGLLGTELQKHIKCVAPSSKELDITESIKKKKGIELVIHAAAYTDLIKAEKEDKKKCYDVNVKGTFNLLEAYSDVPFVFISTEYVRFPWNEYSYTKHLAEELVSSHFSHLIIRTLFKKNPFPHPMAFINQYTQGDYVNIIAPLIVEEIEEWKRIRSKIVYVGTGRKTMHQLALRTREVKKGLVEDVKEVLLPNDYL